MSEKFEFMGESYELLPRRNWTLKMLEDAEQQRFVSFVHALFGDDQFEHLNDDVIKDQFDMNLLVDTVSRYFREDQDSE